MPETLAAFVTWLLAKRDATFATEDWFFNGEYSELHFSGFEIASDELVALAEEYLSEHPAT